MFLETVPGYAVDVLVFDNTVDDIFLDFPVFNLFFLKVVIISKDIHPVKYGHCVNSHIINIHQPDPAPFHISSVIQKEKHQKNRVPIIIMLHEAKEKNLRKALELIDKLQVIKEKTLSIRVEKNLSMPEGQEYYD